MPAQQRVGALPRKSLHHELLHGPKAQVTAPHPEVDIAVPVFILGRAELRPEQVGAGFGALVDGDPVFQESPAPVNHLRSGLDLQRPSATGRDRVRHKPGVMGLHPGKLPLDLHGLLAVNDPIVKDALHPQLVALSRVRMQNDLLISEKVLGNCLPFNFANGTRAWSPFNGNFRRESPENQSFGPTPLDYSGPLLPHHDTVLGGN